MVRFSSLRELGEYARLSRSDCAQRAAQQLAEAPDTCGAPHIVLVMSREVR